MRIPSQLRELTGDDHRLRYQPRLWCGRLSEGLAETASDSTTNSPEARMQRLIEGHKKFLAEVFPGEEEPLSFAGGGTVAGVAVYYVRGFARAAGSDSGDGAGGSVYFAQHRERGADDEPRCGRRDGHDRVRGGGAEGAARIVCGHSDCGALKAALDRKSLENLPKARRWLEHVEAAFAYRQPLNPADGESAELASLIRGNVVAQLKNLQAQMPVRTRDGRGPADGARVVLRHFDGAD